MVGTLAPKPEFLGSIPNGGKIIFQYTDKQS